MFIVDDPVDYIETPRARTKRLKETAVILAKSQGILFKELQKRGFTRNEALELVVVNSQTFRLNLPYLE